MKRTILFSPVGGTDPIPQTNWRDGSLLHICRVYQPSIVYLYMSAEILRLHKADNRYIYCLDKLAQLQNRRAEYHIIERPELNDVQLFDCFYDDFRKIISDIKSKTDADDELLLNISSGTPSMKSALLVLTTLGEYPCRMIQVETPLKKMNEHRHEGYDVELLWEGNEDNAENFVNRCHDIHCPSLSQIKQEEIIKRLVYSYDYEAAKEIAAALPAESTAAYLPIIDLACARMRLDFPAVNVLDKKTGGNLVPMKTGNKQKYFEYALNMDIKRKKREYTDFVRAITPLIVDLFTLILRRECGIDIQNCCKGRPPKWDEAKLKKNYPTIDKLLHDNFKRDFRYGNIYSSALVCIIKKYSQNQKLTALADNLRNIEKNVRNLAAHEIVSLSDEAIKNMTGFNSEDIMKMLKTAFKYTGIGVTQAHWDSYETMNDAIVAAMP